MSTEMTTKASYCNCSACCTCSSILVSASSCSQTVHINFITFLLTRDKENLISNLFPALLHLPLFNNEVNETILVHDSLQKVSPLGHFLSWGYLFVPALTLASCKPLCILCRYVFVYLHQNTVSIRRLCPASLRSLRPNIL